MCGHSHTRTRMFFFLGNMCKITTLLLSTGTKPQQTAPHLHRMKTSSNWTIFSVTGPFCVWNSPVTGEFPWQRPVTRNFYVFFDLRLNKRLRKQSWCWWFETASCSLWRHCNGFGGVYPGCVRDISLWQNSTLSDDMIFPENMSPTFSADRSKDFVVVASDLAPPVPYETNLETWHYRRCNQYKGIPPPQPLTVECLDGAIGRYVYVYLPHSQRLVICEFRVYGIRKYTIFRMGKYGRYMFCAVCWF